MVKSVSYSPHCSDDKWSPGSAREGDSIRLSYAASISEFRTNIAEQDKQNYSSID